MTQIESRLTIAVAGWCLTDSHASPILVPLPGKHVQKSRTVTTDVWVVLCGYSLLSTGASFVPKDSPFHLPCERLAVSASWCTEVPGPADSCGKGQPLWFSYELGKRRLWSDRQRRVSNWLSTPGILDQLKSKTKQQGWGLLLWRVKSQTDLFLCFTSSTLLESRGWLQKREKDTII